MFSGTPFNIHGLDSTEKLFISTEHSQLVTDKAPSIKFRQDKLKM